MIDTILVPTDLTDESRAAEDYAQELAKQVGARCTLVHVIERIEADGEEIERFYRDLEERARPRMEAQVGRFEVAGVTCAARVVVGKRWEEIVKAAEDADLVVMGSRFPLTRDGRPQLGTTSQCVFFAVEKPLLVVRTTP